MNPLNLLKPGKTLSGLLAALALSLPAAAQCEPAPSGIVSWWQAEGSPTDLVGCTTTASVTGAPIYASGMVGQTFVFDSDDDRVVVDHNASLNPNLNTGFSVECWMKGAASQPQSQYAVLDKSHGWVDNTGWTLQGFSGDGKLYLVMGMGGPPPNSNFLSVPSLNSLLDDAWHHVAGTWGPNDDTARLYVDGVLQGTGVLATPANNTRDFLIGYGSGGGTPNRFFRGSVDEVSVYSRPLSGAEVQALFDAGSAGKCIPSAPTYCTAGTSASGCQATISASGTASATAASGFVLSATGLEGAKDGLFFFGTNGRQANPWGNGTSFQCVVPPVQRLGVVPGSGTLGACDGATSLDVNAIWCPTCPKPAKNPGLGALVQAQFWYRDPFNTSNQTTSLSDAVEFCMGP